MLWDTILNTWTSIFTIELTPLFNLIQDNLIQYLTSIDYKNFILNFSFVYYITVFLLLSRILLYFGLTLINLINSKHSIHLKTVNSKNLFVSFIKLNNKNLLKNKFLKLITIVYL